jgi:hypothetical protein
MTAINSKEAAKIAKAGNSGTNLIVEKGFKK